MCTCDITYRTATFSTALQHYNGQVCQVKFAFLVQNILAAMHALKVFSAG